jgi:hypothetical protein
MSIQLIQQYHAQVERIIRYGGSRKPFQDLLEAYTCVTTVSAATMEIINEMPST